MANPSYLIRNYHPKDLDRFVGWLIEAEERRHPWHPLSVQDFLEILSLSWSPENNLFIAEQAGHLVGYAGVRPELSIGRVVLSCFIELKHLRRGLFTNLINPALGRSRELGGKVVQVNIFQNRRAVRSLFEKMGFRTVRQFLELRLDLSKTHLTNIGKICSGCRSLHHDEEDKLVHLQNRSFSGTWGYNLNTREDILRRLQHPHCSIRDVIAAFDQGKPTAYCWTRLDPKKKGYGRIYMLGVDPDHQGRGMGKEVLMAGLSDLKTKGVRLVELTVDHENKAARALYRSVGFRRHKSSLWYEKRLTDL
jgi:polyphosphate kinase